MNRLRVHIALRDKELEDRIRDMVTADGHEPHAISVDTIVNDLRTYDALFIVEESYRTILDLIEFHNSCNFNHLPVIYVTEHESPRQRWVEEVRFPFKYFPVGRALLPALLPRLIAHADELRRTKFNENILRHHRPVIDLFDAPEASFRAALQSSLLFLLDFLFAEKGSIMLLNGKGNLVIEASTKTHLIGMEIEPDPSGPAWSVIESEEPLFVEDISKDSRFAKKAEKYAKDYFLIVPIFLGGTIVGVLNLSDKMVSLLFDRADLLRAKKFIALLEPFLHRHLTAAPRRP